ncbi:MAG: hypothetical protein RIC55_09345 [Pirellulaceae bacterium]
MGVQIWASRRQELRFDAFVVEQIAERRAELAIAVHQDVLLAEQEAVLEVRQFPGVMSKAAIRRWAEVKSLSSKVSARQPSRPSPL